jgi:hypothetical protein
MPPVRRDGPGLRPAVRDYGCGLVAVVGALMLLGCLVGGTVALLTDGVSAGSIVGVGFSVLFWFWIAMGAWRRTVWSSPHN